MVAALQSNRRTCGLHMNNPSHCGHPQALGLKLHEKQLTKAQLAVLFFLETRAIIWKAHVFSFCWVDRPPRLPINT